MKSIRTDPRSHAAEGDERIRTAVTAPSTDPAYEHRTHQWIGQVENALAVLTGDGVEEAQT